MFKCITSASNVPWTYFDRFKDVEDMYLPASGEGTSMAEQIVTAVCKLVYKWYNDGDVFDNTRYLEGWANDLSSYANWLRKYASSAHRILDNVFKCRNDEEYEQLLKDLADLTLDGEYLEKYRTSGVKGSIYDCSGPYQFVDPDEEDYDYQYYDEDEELDDEEW